MSEHRDGRIVTFYSYKGGTGRSMALANVAWILAASGKRVLVADWDLESPGLHRFFAPFIDANRLTGTGGVIDLVREFEDFTTSTENGIAADAYQHFARVQNHAFSIDWTFPDGGTLDFLPAGNQNHDYVASISAMNWDTFYDRLGGRFLDALRDDMKHRYDFTLIDSRTGLGDVADICTIHLPDVLVDCFTLSDQGIDGAAEWARRVDRHTERHDIRILPVPMRVDPAEKGKVDAGLRLAMRRFTGLPVELADEERVRYWAEVQVPYRAFYAYEETLAVFGDPPGSPTTLLAAYETLTRYITEGEVSRLERIDEPVRIRIAQQFSRQFSMPEDLVSLAYAHEDRVWAEWIEQLLVEAGVRVHDPHTEGGVVDAAARQLMIISSATVDDVARMRLAHPTGEAPLAVYRTDKTTMDIPLADSALIGNQPMAVAAERILKLVGRALSDVDLDVVARRVRFPGDEPKAFSVPARNIRFTGREDGLSDLRRHLVDSGGAVVLHQPVALHGMGGIGKTQLAMEYAHRYRSAYDVVWWIAAEPIEMIDAQVAELGRELGIPQQTSVPDTARAVLRALNSGEPYARWLMVFDNADDPDRIRILLPERHGHGHVLVTSRNPGWSESATTIQVDVFRRQESIEHLRKRVTAIADEEADKLAEHLGDLPIALAAAGAWLASTGSSVDDYLTQLSTDAVEEVLGLSLDRLREGSEAAYRLLQLCSLLAPDEIALDLVYSEGMAAQLIPLDPSLTERPVRGRLVNQINRLALLKLDTQSQRDPSGSRDAGGIIQVHRLVQYLVRRRMSDDELAKVRHRAHLVLAAFRPEDDVDDTGTWRSFRMLWPHLEVSGAVECRDEGVRRLLIDRVRYLWLTGELDAGRELAERVEAAWSRQLDEEKDPAQNATLRRQLLHLRFNRANILRDQAHFEQARTLNAQVLEEQTALLSPDHPHTLMTAGSLAADLRALGSYAEALKQDKITHTRWNAAFGEDYPRTLTALSNLASSYRLAGDYGAARERDLEVYGKRRRMLGDDHLDTLLSASNLGRDHREAGEYVTSVRMLTEVMDAYTRVFGRDSRRTFTAATNLAVSLRSAGRSGDAARLLDWAYERLNDLFGPGNPETLACRHSRAVNLLAQDQPERASRELEAVREAYGTSLNPRHPHTLVCVSNLAMVRRRLHERRNALELADEASRDLVDVMGKEHPYALAANANLAICTAEMGDLDAALEIARATLERLQAVLGDDHPDAVRCQANLVLVLRALGRLDDATTELERVTGRLGGRLGDEHPAVTALHERRYLHRMIDPHPF